MEIFNNFDLCKIEISKNLPVFFYNRFVSYTKGGRLYLTSTRSCPPLIKYVCFIKS